MIAVNPCDRVRPPKKARPTLPQWDEESTKLFLAETKRSSAYHPVYLTAVLTGMRRGELLGLRWADVDLLLGTVTVQQTHFEVGGKVGFKPPKTANSRRTLDLPSVVIEEFRRIRTEQEKSRELLGERYAADLDLIFAQPNGRPLYGDNLAKDFHRVIKRAKVRRIRFHDLRHLHVGLLIDQGENSRLISERLGHSSVGFTLSQYGFLMKGAQRAAVSKLESRIFGTAVSSTDQVEHEREAS
jgi:integrase